MSRVLSNFEHAHRDLGRVIGVSHTKDIVQFRGIPFAHIPGRFRQSVLETKLPFEPFDATKTGPCCPQPVPSLYPDYWSGPVSNAAWTPSLPKQDEFACLNLNVTAPQAALEQGSKMPVLVFIHGGGLNGGSHGVQICGREIFDATDLVRDSVRRDRSTVVVTINYRIGLLGFLASDELRDFNKVHDEAVGNYGLHDQRQALEWVSRYISGFGGDAANITIHGSSAGGVSCHYQSMFPDRKFRRAILASGTITSLGPRQLDQHQPIFNELRDIVLESQSNVLAVVEHLQAVPVDKLVSAVPQLVCYPLIENEWIAKDYLDLISHMSDPPVLMVGSCAFEVGFFPSPAHLLSEPQEIMDLILRDPKTMIPLSITLLVDKARELLNENQFLHSPEGFPLECPGILQQYGLDANHSEENSSSQQWIQLISDIVFRIPALNLALTIYPEKVLVYDFQATNPFPGAGPSYRKANHAVNDLFLFDVASDLVPEEHRSDWAGAVDQLRWMWLDFCHGIFHWEPMSPISEGVGDDVGPIYAFIDGGKGLAASLRQTIGEDEAIRWTSVLYAASHGNDGN